MGIGIKLLGGGGSGGGSGVLKVSNAAARLALTPTDGLIVIQLDTDVLYEYDGTSSSWKIIGASSVPIAVTDTNSIDLTLTANNLSADIILSGAAASANNQKVNLSVVASGVLAQITDAAIRSVISGTAPVSYDNSTGVISMAAATDSVDGYLTAADHTALTGVVAGLAAHLADTSAAHAASAISFTPTGNIGSSDVQAAIAELDSETDSRLDSLEAVSHVAVTVTTFGSTPNANGISLSTQQIQLQPADGSNPGGVSIAAQTFAGEKTFANGVDIGSGSLGASQIFQITSTSKGSNPMPSMTTAQRTAISSPATGLMVYDTDLKGAMFYDGAQWQFMDGRAVIAAAQTPAAAATLTPLGYRNQILPISGSGGAVTLADLGIANALAGDILTLIGTDDTNTVTVVSSTNTVINGSCTLGLDATLRLEFYSSKWREISRSN